MTENEEREAFEAHIRSTWKVPESYLDWALTRPGGKVWYYNDNRATDQWSGWISRAAISRATGAEAGE